MDRAERLKLFIDRLKAAPAAASYKEARALLTATMNGVEDEHSGVPYDPVNWAIDGRLYPPHDDHMKTSEIADVVVFHSRGHQITFGQNGSITILGRRGAMRGKVVLDKKGK